MNPMIQTVFDYIDRHEKDMVKLWKNLVSQETPSADRAANTLSAAHLDTYLDSMGLERNIVTFEKAGPTLTAWTAEGRLKPVALIGHFDTVHPAGSFGTNLFRVEGDTVYGPGVFDMKGGIVIELFAIRALLAAGFTDRQIRLVLSGDEEVAHAFSNGESGRVMEKMSDGCAAVFNCESGLPDREVTTRRKGGAILGVKIHGRAAHAGRNPQDGASAILQAAHIITELDKHSDFGAASFNSGRISGGKGANVIPDYCEISIGLRYATNEQYENACTLVHSLCDHPVVPGVTCEVEQRGFYPAMEPPAGTDILLGAYQDACRLLGEPIPRGAFQGGCSDSAFVTRKGIPALCSLGVTGGSAHALDEHAQISSLAIQCKKLAASILLLPEDF